MVRLAVDDHIELRLHTVEDADEEWRFLSENMQFLSQWVDWAQPTYTAADVRRDMGENLSKYQVGEMYVMGIYIDDELVGNVDIRDIVDGDSAEVGYLLGEAHTGKGIVTRSMQTLMDYVQDKHNVPTFYLNTYSDNEASIRVAERLGFKLKNKTETSEGRLESHYVRTVKLQKITGVRGNP